MLFHISEDSIHVHYKAILKVILWKYLTSMPLFNVVIEQLLNHLFRKKVIPPLSIFMASTCFDSQRGDAVYWSVHLVNFKWTYSVKVFHIQAMKTTNIIKKIISTAKILIISHRLDVTDWKYFKISEWAASIFTEASSTLESILQRTESAYTS